MLRRFWKDDGGAIMSTELVILVTVVGLGIVAGATQLRNSVNNELNDVSSALRGINQSYYVPPIQSRCGSYVSGSYFTDQYATQNYQSGIQNPQQSQCVMIYTGGQGTSLLRGGQIGVIPQSIKQPTTSVKVNTARDIIIQSKP